VEAKEAQAWGADRKKGAKTKNWGAAGKKFRKKLKINFYFK